MIYEVWTIAVVPFPFTDALRSKPRPTLIVSRRHFNESHGHCLLAMITTAAHSRWPSDHPIEDWAGAGLRGPCVVRLKLFTLESRLVDRGIGVLGKTDRAAVAKRLREMLGSAS